MRTRSLSSFASNLVLMGSLSWFATAQEFSDPSLRPIMSSAELQSATDEQVLALVAQTNVQQTDPEKISALDADAMTIAHERKLISESQWWAFCKASLTPRVVIRERLRAGGLARVEIDLQTPKRSQQMRGSAYTVAVELHLGGQALKLDRQENSVIQFSASSEASSPSGVWFRLPETLGTYEPRLRVTFGPRAREDLEWNRGNEGQWTREVNLDKVELVGPGVRLIEFIDDPAQARAYEFVVRPTLQCAQGGVGRWIYETISLSVVDRNAFDNFAVRFREPAAVVSSPQAVMLTKNMAIDRRSFSTMWILPDRRGSRDYATLGEYECSDVQTVELVMAPDIERAEGMPGVTRVLNHTFKFKRGELRIKR